jgi:D-alanyl-lipoteichoic acid acyltransferase DltB (MBOAT superfamily)
LALAAVLFALQIYGDFSGYSDIAIGTARLFGIRLRDNFLTPYFSRNVAEFWKRWHISLNTWFVDYVYIPLGGSRHGILRTILNTFVIFILSGLWHGANWTFLGWGFYHALLFVPLVLIGTNKKYKVQDKPLLKQFPSMLLTFVLVTLGWILFRATSITEAMRYVAYVFDGSLFSVPWLMSRKFWAPLFVSIVVMFVFEWLGRGGGYGLSFMRGRPRVLQAFVYYVVIAMIFVWHSTEGIQFIYFQF